MFSPQIHRYIFLFGLFALGFGMMVGTVPTSVPQMILMGNWLLEADFKNKWQQLKSNKVFWILSSVFLLHVLGLLWTEHLGAGWDDVRTKIPMLFLPLLFFSSEPLSQVELKRLFYCFIAGCIANTAWCLIYTHLLHKNEGVRKASRFMSHIRLGLYLNIAIAICIHLYRDHQKVGKAILVLIVFYFVFCMYALGLASGLVNFVLLVFLLICYLAYKQQLKYKLVFLGILVLFLSAFIFYVRNVATAQLNVRQGAQNIKQEKTPWGASYIHFEDEGQKENGNYVLINIELQELRRGWNRRMPADTFSFIPAVNLQRYEVLVRYLASKGLNKDSAGIVVLNEEDFQNIHKNIYNYKFPAWSFLHRRVYEAVNEFDDLRHQGRVNGHSFSMRPYFWKAAFHGIQLHPVFGTGTGDVQSEMNAAYKAINSPLFEEWHIRPHNQFITVTVALGIVGLLVFLIFLIYPAYVLRKSLSKLYWFFLILAILSFTVEDTLETQAGQTFFSFFNVLFLAEAYNKK